MSPSCARVRFSPSWTPVNRTERLLIALYSIRADRQFCEQLHYNIFRWFLDMGLKSTGLDQSNVSLLRGRLGATYMGCRLSCEVVSLARREKLLSSRSFHRRRTLIEAWASFKSFNDRSTV